MLTDQLRIFAAEVVENMTSTFQRYAVSTQGIPVFTDTIKSYTTEALHQSQALTASKPLKPWAVLATFTVLYLSLVQTLRFRDLRKLNMIYVVYLKDPYKLDYKVAHGIMKQVILYEAPWVYGFRTQMARVKTYAVAAGTGLPAWTRQLT
jgi:hypothetical protein